MMPPTTAPISVHVTSEPACGGVRCSSGGDRPQHEAENKKIEAIHRIADGRAPHRFGVRRRRSPRPSPREPAPSTSCTWLISLFPFGNDHQPFMRGAQHLRPCCAVDKGGGTPRVKAGQIMASHASGHAIISQGNGASPKYCSGKFPISPVTGNQPRNAANRRLVQPVSIRIAGSRRVVTGAARDGLEPFPANPCRVNPRMQ